jgi:glycosyltransferase involved in cell wall biosynthesis
MKIAILTSGILPVPAVQGGAVENLIDFYLEYNCQNHQHDITVYSVWNPDISQHPALLADCNHYKYIDTSSLWAKIRRKIYGLCHRHEYYNYYIEYFFERAWQDIKHKDYDCIMLENRPGYAVKLSQRGVCNMVLHLHNDLLNATTPHHQEIFDNLSRILTVSDYIKGRVSTITLSDKLQTVHNGINIDSFSVKSTPTITRQSLGLSDADFLMVYSGRINKDKGVSELIDAMLQLEKFPTIKLMILGSSFFNDSTGEDVFINNLKNKAEAIKDRIVFTGFIPYRQVPAYLHIADIAVLPSMWEEPFGLTIVEAMAAGLPLITTRSGGIPEICEGVATIVDKENVVNNLASAILDLYHHPEKRAQMSKASIERAQQFDKETYSKKFFAALENL